MLRLYEKCTHRRWRSASPNSTFTSLPPQKQTPTCLPKNSTTPISHPSYPTQQPPPTPPPSSSTTMPSTCAYYGCTARSATSTTSAPKTAAKPSLFSKDQHIHIVHRCLYLTKQIYLQHIRSAATELNCEIGAPKPSQRW
jgi:hypothetical protein